MEMEEVLIRERKIKSLVYSLEEKNEEAIFFDYSTCRMVKRSLDILISLSVILLILSWLIPLMAILIKSDSKGPVFFLQKRKGLNKRIFTCIKFRTMIKNEEAHHIPVRKHDPRVTKTGRFLREHYIDELPQFLNVFWGTMTLVGPRPHMIREDQKYEKIIPNYSFRYRVKPGITGLGQVKNDVPEPSLQKMENRIYWDTYYIKNWSHRLDLKILYQTLILCLYPGYTSSSFQDQETVKL